MKKIIFFFAFALVGATGFGQVKATDVKPKAEVACKDLVYGGVYFKDAVIVKRGSICIAPIGEGETFVTYTLYNSESALASGVSSGNTIPIAYPSVGMDIEANETIIRAKLAQILGVKIADVDLK